MRRSEQARAEDALLRDATRRFLEEDYKWAADRTRTSDLIKTWRTCADLGWFALGLPATLNGAGGDSVQCLAILEEAGRVLHDAPLLANILLAPPVLSKMPADIATELGNGLATGDVRFAYIPQDTITLSSDGRLDGSSGLALGVDIATHWIVPASSPNPSEAAVIIVDPSDSGYRRDTRLIDGRAASVITFDRWRLPAHRTVIRSIEASRLAASLSDRATIGACAEALGALDAGLSLTVEYLNQRVQFNATLSSFQAIQHMMAESFCEIAQIRSLLIWAAAALDSDAPERPRAASALKTYTSRQGVRAAARCVQVSGGIGMTDEYRIGHVYKKLLVTAALFGNVDHHASRLHTLLTAQPKSIEKAKA
ncbi:acyl-CoA dehydrogenase family protein [Mesorhizobium sp. NZP2298]|uniref:acyl-CoA dehydrogenase family protein n=1 Tax=Mesorhizobium sp. NZP2298 TaxID=2483403 RepID=UPI001554EFE7|nr:acyl-CoA dehydrogenase [Mesorhizobium sp. NZP2298]QKC98402.1 acyl-CoA dehydrogenase [Mesorhizobium sp. NZP2298]